MSNMSHLGDKFFLLTEELDCDDDDDDQGFFRTMIRGAFQEFGGDKFFIPNTNLKSNNLSVKGNTVQTY